MSRILFSVHRGGLPQCMLGYHPPDQAGTPWDQAGIPPGSGNPPGTRHPPAQCMLGDTVNKRAVCILLECNLNTEFKFIVYLQPFQVVQIILRCSSVRIPKRKLKIHHWFCFIAYLQCTDQEHKAQVHSKILYERRFLSLLVNS